MIAKYLTKACIYARSNVLFYRDNKMFLPQNVLFHKLRMQFPPLILLFSQDSNRPFPRQNLCFSLYLISSSFDTGSLDILTRLDRSFSVDSKFSFDMLNSCQRPIFSRDYICFLDLECRSLQPVRSLGERSPFLHIFNSWQRHIIFRERTTFSRA